MDIKSKKSKLYSQNMKVFAVILIFVATIATYLSLLEIIKFSNNWYASPTSVNTYFDTSVFREKFDSLMDKAVNVHVKYKSESEIEEGRSIDRDTLIESFKSYYNIIDGVITDNTEINASFNGLRITGTIPEDLEENFKEYKYLVEKRLPQYRKMFIQTQLDSYRRQYEYLKSYKNFYYYIQNESENKIAGNSSIDEITKLDRNIIIEGSFSMDNIGSYYTGYINSVLADSNCKMYAGIKEPLIQGDEFYDDNINFNAAKKSMPIYSSIIVFSIVLFIFLVIYLIKVAGQTERHGEITFKNTDKLYNDVHLILILIATIISVLMAKALFGSIFYREFDLWSIFWVVILGMLIIFDEGIGLNFIISMTRQIKARCILRNTLIVAILRKIGSIFTKKTFCGWMVFLMLGYAFVNILLTLVLFQSFFYNDVSVFFIIGVVIIVFNIASAAVYVRYLSSISKLMVAANEISHGNLNYKLDMACISPSFINFANDISNIQIGMKSAVEEAVKGERMKADLITNVSHDLKTPLTSIISYVDILDKEKLDNEKAEGYVDVLVEKTGRLKQLIEDLIEASKASSGNLSVSFEKINLRELVMQARGEFEEKIEKANIDFRINCVEEVSLYADGKHMWRIIENLFSNAIKYSMAHTRVYVEVYKDNESNTGILIIKNISAQPIEVATDQLTERFVRGDDSRTTEGSGLGLSIAKSLTLLQDGEIFITVDGDLFKVTVKIPIWKEVQQDINNNINNSSSINLSKESFNI